MPATFTDFFFRVSKFFFYLIFTAVTCSVKITWYILVLLVFMVGIILIIYKILEGHRRVQRWQSKYWEVTPGHMAFPRETCTNTCSPQIFFLVRLAAYCVPPVCKCWF